LVSYVKIAIVSNDGSGLGDEIDHVLAKSVGALANDVGLVPLDFEAFARLDGGPRGIGNDSDAGASVVAAAGTGGFAELVRHVNRGNFEDAANARKGFHFIGIEGARSSSVGRAAFHAGDEHSGDACVYAEDGGAVDFRWSVGAAHGFAEEREVGGAFQGRIGGKRKPGSDVEELFERDFSLRWGMQDEAIFGATFCGGNSPLRGSRRNQEFACGGAGFMKRFERTSNTATAAGDLVAIFGVEVGLNDFDAAPIAGQLFGDDHGERGKDALTHFGVAAPDCYFAGGRNFEPGVESE